MNLFKAFDIPPKSSVAIVGAGGKTTLLYRLAREMAPEAAKAGGIVLITTTTKIFRTTEEEAEAVIVSAGLEEARKQIRKAARKDVRVVLAAGSHADPRYGRDKLDGIPPDWAGPLIEMDEVAWLLAEADGAQRRPLKAPGEGEPVWPRPVHLAIGLLGLSALGRPLDRESVFRPERAASVTGLAEGEAIGLDAYGALLARPDGIFRGCPEGARLIGFLNQSDECGRVVPAGEIRYILRGCNLVQLESVFSGSLERDEIQRVQVG